MASASVVEGNMWAVQKLMMFENTDWTEVNEPNMILRINYDLLVLMSNDTVLLNLNLNKDLKGYFRDNVLILAFKKDGVLNKVKLLCSHDDIDIITSVISIYSPVHDLTTEKNADLNLTNFQLLFKEEMLRQTNYCNIDSVFPPGFPLKDFMKMCIMDSAFPQMVDQIEKAIHEFLH